MTRITSVEKCRVISAPRNPVVGFLVTHPNRGAKKHEDKKRKSKMPTAGQVKRLLEQEDQKEE